MSGPIGWSPGNKICPGKGTPALNTTVSDGPSSSTLETRVFFAELSVLDKILLKIFSARLLALS